MLASTMPLIFPLAALLAILSIACSWRRYGAVALGNLKALDMLVAAETGPEPSVGTRSAAARRHHRRSVRARRPTSAAAQRAAA